MSASSYSGSGLTESPNYSQLLGFIEFVEGYKGLAQGAVPGQLYYDSVGIPTIGYGFALVNNDGSVNVNTLAAVLDGLVLNGQTYVPGQVNDNVFVAASQGSSPLTQGQVLDYFSWLVKTYGNRSTPIGELQGFLTDALQQFFAGNGSTLYNSGIYLLPVEGDVHENISFAFSPTNRANAEAVLSNLVAGATLFEHSTGTGNELVISGYSPGLYQTIENEGKVDGNGNVIRSDTVSRQNNLWKEAPKNISCRSTCSPATVTILDATGRTAGSFKRTRRSELEGVSSTNDESKPLTSMGIGVRVMIIKRGIAAALFGLLTSCLPFLAQAQTADLPACLHKVVRFDGSRPLQFERVIGPSEARLYIHASYPMACVSETKSCAGGPSYLLAGDEVAGGKSCGKWTYIQYIGVRHVTKGWVDSSRLNFLREAGASTARLLFTLTKGHGTPVCEAYLQRLNVTDYQQNFPTAPAPYCGIPENDQIPGFAMLHRVPLSSDELIKLSGDVYKWWERPNPHLTGDWNATPEQVRLGGLVAWRYETPLDVNNDGKRQNVMVWRGYGLSGAAGRCGEPMNQNYTWGVRWQQLPLIMKGNLQIDQARTAEVFGRVFIGGSHEELTAGHPFSPVGFFVTPFVYKETTYFSAFFDDNGDYEGKRRGVWRLWNVMGVLARSRGRTQELCEYRLRGDDYPKANTGLEQ